MIWTNTAFEMYMGQHDVVTASEFEPARRREVLLGNLADTQRSEPVKTSERSSRRIGLGTMAISALTAGRRLVRN